MVPKLECQGRIESCTGSRDMLCLLLQALVVCLHSIHSGNRETNGLDWYEYELLHSLEASVNLF
jgi:hypothetical protein